jgi:hypothetical protein
MVLDCKPAAAHSCATSYQGNCCHRVIQLPAEQARMMQRWPPALRRSGVPISTFRRSAVKARMRSSGRAQALSSRCAALGAQTRSTRHSDARHSALKCPAHGPQMLGTWHSDAQQSALRCSALGTQTLGTRHLDAQHSALDRAQQRALSTLRPSCSWGSPSRPPWRRP